MDDLLIFDGVCNLCARSVRFVLQHEGDHTLRFTPLQSPLGSRLLRELGFDPTDAKTFVLVSGGKAHVKSEAALRLSRRFRGGWRLLGILSIVPRPLRDWAYDRVAQNRYRWFGRTEACMVPTPELRARFLE